MQKIRRPTKWWNAYGKTPDKESGAAALHAPRLHVLAQRIVYNPFLTA
jgi:hypothetical protein